MACQEHRSLYLSLMLDFLQQIFFESREIKPGRSSVPTLRFDRMLSGSANYTTLMTSFTLSTTRHTFVVICEMLRIGVN